LALAWAADRPEQSRQALDKALDLNPRLHPALLFRVDRLIDAERYDEAGRLLDRVQQVNPHDPDAWAFRAVVAHLSNEPLRETACRTKALRHWDKNPAVDHLIGLKLSQKYRFAEGAAYQRQSLVLDPQFVPARVQLCQDLLRLGQEDEGWKLAEEVHEAHRHDVVTHNLLELRDRIAKFRTLENEDFIVRMSADEADVYGERVLALLGRAKRALCEKYGLELDDKVTIEIFPDESDFAVRTFGMPGESGFLGVCFGKVITANSPASQTEQPANWEAVLWHEFCHVVTLELTQNRMPRWLSEGISVYEESQADPTWGQSMNPQYRALILGGELTPVSELSGAFVSPESPQHVQFAYYESALVVEYLIERHGLETLQDVLRDLKAGLPINVALDRRTDGLASLEREFARFARRKAEALAPGVDFDDPDASAVTSDDPAELEQWVRRNPRNFAGLMCRAQTLLDEEAWEQARTVLERAVRLYPGYVGNDNAYEMLAFAYRQLDRPDDERRVLVRYAERDCIALRAFLRLLELQVEAEDWSGALQTAERAMAVNPMLPQPYRARVRAAEALGRSDEAMLAYRTLLSIRTEEEPDRTRVGALPRPEGVHGARGERGTRIR
jgi:tetratricopeptide (TPR) repeat protein